MDASRSTLPPGTAPIKQEYLLSTRPAPASAPDDDDAENTRRADDQISSEPPAKRAKLSNEKPQRGANKSRKFAKVTDQLELCWKLSAEEPCEFGEKCKFTHDVTQYLSTKPHDIKFPPSPVLDSPSSPPSASSSFPSIDFSTKCPVFEERGVCRHALKCRFLGGHASIVEGRVEVVRDAKREKEAQEEMNFPRAGVLKALRTKQYPTPVADEYIKLHQRQSAVGKEVVTEDGKRVMVYDEAQGDEAGVGDGDTPDVPIRPSEKKRLHWEGKTYLAPLTTVGNLPFRRLCTQFGADITCGEMALSTSLLSGSKEEWSLVRRHPSERTFGVQLAGNKPGVLVPAAEVLAREFGAGAGGVDFVDLNCGCPIDLVFKNGAGAALLDQPGKLGKILVGMNKALGEIPLTLKVRTGVKEGRNTAHRLMARVGGHWGASAITVHGRTRQQRYTKLADWDYIKQCVEALRAASADDDLPPIPIFGGGDCYSSAHYWDAVEKTGVDGVMVARGALIKPWIFTEIKERREWDISARERLDIIRTYAEYGLNHFGSDTAGVNTTRRYLCEALSFQYRYIPIGLLERLPGRMNDRPPGYRGRDELETMLGSGDSRTWVKISEMFLGDAPDRFVFTPKHKSNAHVDVEAQG